MLTSDVDFEPTEGSIAEVPEVSLFALGAVPNVFTSRNSDLQAS